MKISGLYENANMNFLTSHESKAADSETKKRRISRVGADLDEFEQTRPRTIDPTGTSGSTAPVVPAPPSPGKRSTGEVQGVIIGYDANHNPIIETDYFQPLKESTLDSQTIDHTEAYKDVTSLVQTLSSNERLSTEFYHYLTAKYKDADRSPDGNDIYINPQNYTPEQKMARYIDLIKLKGQWQQYKAYRSEPYTGVSATIKNIKEIDKDIDESIKTLMEDPELTSVLVSEYILGFKEILSGKRFQSDEGKYDEAYDNAVSSLRAQLEAEFDYKIADGAILKDGIARSVNEATILSKYKFTLNAYGSLLSADFIDSRKDRIEAIYQSFYSEEISPLLPDTSDSMQKMIYQINRSAIAPEDLDAVGLVTPLVDGKSYVDLGLGLTASGLMRYLNSQKADEKTKRAMKDLGLEGKIAGDGFDAAYLPAVSIIADQVIGTDPALKSERADFIEAILTELRPLAAAVDSGTTADWLGGALEKIRARYKALGGSVANRVFSLTTALNGLVRGSILASNMLLQGMARAQIGGSAIPLVDMQAMLALGAGYEGKGLALSGHPEGVKPNAFYDGSLAKKTFGTESRLWDSGMLNWFGADVLKTYSVKMAKDFRYALPGQRVSPVIYSLLEITPEVDKQLFVPLAQSIAEGLFGDDQEAISRFMTNVPNIMHNIWSSFKPGGNIQRVFTQVSDLVSQSGGWFNEGTVTIDAQKKAVSKWTAALMVGTRTVFGGTTNANNLNPSTIASIALYSTQAGGYMLDLAGMTLKDPGLDAKTLYRIGHYADAARKAGQTFASKGGSALGSLVDIAYVPVNIMNFVRGLKDGQFDTTEKVLQGFIMATDLGVAFDAAISLARTFIPSTTLQVSRFASLFTGPGGALVSALGGAFNLINAGALIGFAIYQNIKESKRANRLTSEMDDSLWKLTRNSVSQHLDYSNLTSTPWDTDAQVRAAYESLLYKEDVTPEDWSAIREANRQRNEVKQS